jgi:hypothetical protein
MFRRVVVAGVAACVLGLTFGFSQTANAQDRLGGHFGIVLPLVKKPGRQPGIQDDFSVGNPMTVTVKTTDKV